MDRNGFAEPCPENEIQNIANQFYSPGMVTEEAAEKFRQDFEHVSIRNMMKVYSIIRRRREDQWTEALFHRRCRQEKFAADMADMLAVGDHVG